MKLYIVRHGETTVWNALHKVQGSADIPLAEKGISVGCQKTGQALKDVSFDVCFTSPAAAGKTDSRTYSGETAKAKSR